MRIEIGFYTLPRVRMEDRKVKYEKISSWFGSVTEVKGSPYHRYRL